MSLDAVKLNNVNIPNTQPNAVARPDLGQMQTIVERTLQNACSNASDINPGRALQFFILAMGITAVICLAVKGSIVAPSIIGAGTLVGTVAFEPWARKEEKKLADLENHLNSIAGTNHICFAKCRLLTQDVIYFVALQALCTAEPEKCDLSIIMTSDAFKARFAEFYSQSRQ